ncbi:MAG: hypothetical protein ACYS0G_00985 [Planctomycetota bacterium]|jgi:hypothetical protein
MPRRALVILFAVIVAAGVAAAVIASARGRAIRVHPALAGVIGTVVGVTASWIVLRTARLGGAAGARTRPRAAEVAEQLGLSYLAEADAAFREGFRGMPEIPKNAKIRHVLDGVIDGRPLVVFQSSYLVYTGQAVMQVAHTIYAVEGPAWPPTRIAPRNLFGRLAVRLGRRPGLTLEDPEFNARIKVKTEDEDFAVALLSPDMQAFMLAKTAARWQIDRGRVCLVYRGALKPARIEDSLERMRTFWSLVPEELEAWS